MAGEAPIYGYDLGGSSNAVRANDTLALRGLWMTNPSIEPGSEFAGSAALTVVGSTSAAVKHTIQTHWYQGGWWDACDCCGMS